MEESIIKLLQELKKVKENNVLQEPENKQVLELAFIGDTIFDLFSRDYLIRKYDDKIKMNDLHKKNAELVCAKSQARIVETLINSNFLTDEEINYYKHARNAHSGSKSKNSSIVDYRKATGFEALLGLLLYKNDIERMIQYYNKLIKCFDMK